MNALESNKIKNKFLEYSMSIRSKNQYNLSDVSAKQIELEFSIAFSNIIDDFVEKNKITFATLDVKKRKVLLTALDFKLTNLKCELCNEKTTKEVCCIMPSLHKTKNATILCNSTLCMSEYITKIEK